MKFLTAIVQLLCHHDTTAVNENHRRYLVCSKCGHVSPGWDLTPKGQVPGATTAHF